MSTLFTALSAMALVGGGLNYFFFPQTLGLSLKYMINLNPNGLVYPMYMNPPFKTKALYYIYSVKNPKAVLLGEKMEFDVKGPYVYSVAITRDNIAFMKDGEVLQYDSHRTLFLDEQQSADVDEKFWVINPIFPGVHSQVKAMVMDKVPFKRVAEPIVYNSVNVVLDQFKERLLIKKTPRDLLQGMRVDLLASLTGLANRLGLGSLIPPGPPEDTFGFAHYQNHTFERLMIYTGTGSTREKFGEVIKWKEKNYINFWKGKCGQINGTNGELYKAFPKPGQPLTVMVPQLCRTFTLDPVSTDLVTLDSGIKTLEYKLGDKLFQGVRKNPSNRCFCQDLKAYDCQLDGFINMGPCFFDSPLFFTKPNLEGVDPRMRSLVDEQSLTAHLPDKQNFWLEPITGTVLKANLTLLGVFKVVRQPYMRDLARIQNVTYAPVFQATEIVELPYYLVWQIHYLQMFYNNHKLIFMGMAGTGAGLLLFKYLFLSGSVRAEVAPAPAS